MSGILDGRVALVAGAAGGVGRALAGMLAGHGAALVLAGGEGGDVEAVAAGLSGPVIAVGGDPADPEVPDRVVRAALAAFGTIDIVVNHDERDGDAPPGAGGAAVEEATDEQLLGLLARHATAPFRLLRAAAPVLRGAAKREREEGREVFRKVVNVTTVAATMGEGGRSGPAAAGAALIGLTKALAKEWGPLKINVNAVALGPPPGGAVPLGRPPSPEEAAAGVFLLCTPWSDFVHGQVLTVAGGFAAGMTA